MSFVYAASHAIAAQKGLRPMLAAIVILVLAGNLISCSGNGKVPTLGTGNTAYVTLPNNGSVLMLHLDGANGSIAVQSSTPGYVGTTPYGLALAPSKNFLYVANSQSNNISTFSVAGDGSLSLIATTPDGGSGPHDAVIDPSGNYLLVTNSGLSNNVSVFSIDTSTGVLTAVPGSPFLANDSPSEILVSPTDNFVYVSNPGSGMVTAFTFDSSSGFLTEVRGSPFFSGSGASALAFYTGSVSSFLYVANTSTVNAGSTTTGNISAFSVNSTTGVLTPVKGTPFAPTIGTGPSTLVIDPTGRFLFATTPGSSFSIWCFDINSVNGVLTVANDSPFNGSAGGLFALIDTNGNYFYIGSAQSKGIAAYTYDTNTGQPTEVNDSPFSTGAVPGKMVIVP